MSGFGDVSIDVIIPARGRTDLVERALVSVANQTVSPSNVFVVDDGSAVPIKDVLDTRFEDLCTVIRYKPGKGGGHARNVGIDAASSDWIAFLDSDDWWEPDHLEIATGCVGSNKCDAVVSAYRAVFKPRGEIIYRSPLPEGPIPDFAEYMFCLGGLCRTSTFLVQRVPAQSVKFDNGGHEDWDFMLRFARAGHVFYSDHVTVNVDHDAAGRFSQSRDPGISFRFLAKHYNELTKEQRNGFRLRAARSGALHAQRELAWPLIRGMESPVSAGRRLHALVSLVLSLHPVITKGARVGYLALSRARNALYGKVRT